MATAATASNITTSPTTLYATQKYGGTDPDETTEITFYNKGTAEVQLSVQPHHKANEFIGLPAGASLPIRLEALPNLKQIDRVTAQTASGTATLSWGVTGRR